MLDEIMRTAPLSFALYYILRKSCCRSLMDVFNLEQLSDQVWKVVEGDRFRQYPFLYIIMGEDKCILLDTGCGMN